MLGQCVVRTNLRNHISDYKFCLTNVYEYNLRSKKNNILSKLSHPQFALVRSADLVPTRLCSLDNVGTCDDTDNDGSNSDERLSGYKSDPQLFAHAKLNCLVRYTDLTKESVE